MLTMRSGADGLQTMCRWHVLVQTTYVHAQMTRGWCADDVQTMHRQCADDMQTMCGWCARDARCSTAWNLATQARTALYKAENGFLVFVMGWLNWLNWFKFTGKTNQLTNMLIFSILASFVYFFISLIEIWHFAQNYLKTTLSCKIDQMSLLRILSLYKDQLFSRLNCLIVARIIAFYPFFLFLFTPLLCFGQNDVRIHALVCQ